jgi:hypothetical protein
LDKKLGPWHLLHWQYPLDHQAVLTMLQRCSIKRAILPNHAVIYNRKKYIRFVGKSREKRQKRNFSLDQEFWKYLNKNMKESRNVLLAGFTKLFGAVINSAL